MPADTASLRKILGLESRHGFTDQAVIGGLDRFLRNWAASTMASLSDRRLMARFRRLGLERPAYAAMTPEERRRWVKSLLGLLDALEAPPASRPTPARPRARAKPAVPPPPVTPPGGLDAPITTLRGVSTTVASRFARLGVHTLRDLLYFFPNRHLDYSRRKTISELQEGPEETIVANIWQVTEVRPGGRPGTEAILGDETGNVRAVWFNNPYLVRQLSRHSRIILSGRVRIFNGRPVFESPEWEPLTDDLVHTGRLVPLYPLTQGLRARQVRALVKTVVDHWASLVPEFLPDNLRERCRLLPLPSALQQAHYPDSYELKDRARVRLAFDELFLLQLGVLSRKREWQQGQMATPLPTPHSVLDTFVAALPFSLTGAQQRVLAEVLADLTKPQAMSRLLQGEVGSGKTVIATAALLTAAASGYQAAMMAPTEILAEQHFTTINRLLAAAAREEKKEPYLTTYSGLLERPLSVALLIGAVPAARKRQLHRLISRGQVDIVVGTHAIIQQQVEFRHLALAVVDEQHRFGVEQRSSLRQKGLNPHVLAMTATPIPRTLALTLYGDLDLSVIDELPPGRQEIKTKWLRPEQRPSAYNFIRRQVAAGRQAFIICPLIEESEAVQARAAMAEYERLSREVFPELRLGLLHGRMSAAAKEDVMRRFYQHELDILVSTAVVEVGVDVPNATVMMVESADRFGLSQLHQFRGRVGRGPEPSYCMLMAREPSEVARQRLDIIENVQDGFRLAEEDLRLRGPGEFFGTRQSGLPDLRMARLSDVPLLEMARAEAVRLFNEDPGLDRPEHRPLVLEMQRVWAGKVGERS